MKLDPTKMKDWQIAEAAEAGGGLATVHSLDALFYPTHR